MDDTNTANADSVMKLENEAYSTKMKCCATGSVHVTYNEKGEARLNVPPAENEYTVYQLLGTELEQKYGVTYIKDFVQDDKIKEFRMRNPKDLEEKIKDLLNQGITVEPARALPCGSDFVEEVERMNKKIEQDRKNRAESRAEK